MASTQLYNQDELVYATDDCLEEIINNTRAVRQDSERSRFKVQVNNFLAEVVSGALVISSDLIGSVEKRIAEIDAVMSEQLSLIMHAPEFQKKESAWTGLYKLVQASITENVKYSVLHCTKQELLKDFKSASDFDQSVLFKNIYESEYGTFGGTPYSIFVGDFFLTIPHKISNYLSIFLMLLLVHMLRF